MSKDDIKLLEKDTEGLTTYEFLVNNLSELKPDDLNAVIERLSAIDLNGQYLASSARYLNAINKDFFAEQVKHLVSLTIDRDRERRYIGELAVALYGKDYTEHSTELMADNNFRRLYKRLYPNGII